MKISKRTILITGGTSGIGFELARRLSAADNKVIITGREESKLQAAQKALPGVHGRISDVSDPIAIEQLYQQMIQEFPGLNTLVNNAGIMRNITLSDEQPLSDIVREIEIILNGPIRMIQKFLPHLLSQPDAMIVNMTTGLAFVPFPAAPIYSAAKAGLRAYTRTLRVQLKQSRVRVIEVAPPAVDTQLYRNLLEGDQSEQSIKPMPLDKLADAVMTGLASGKEEILPGMSKALKILSRVAPEFGLRQLAKASGL